MVSSKHKSISRQVICFVACLPLSFLSRAAADVVEIEAVIASGMYDGGVHFPHHMNYFVGYSIPSSPLERRNYFVFNLVDIDKPIVSAKLKLFLPGGPELPLGYISSDPTEEYLVSHTPFPAEMFIAAFMGDPGITPPIVEAMFGTLGTGSPYGLTVVSADDGGSDVILDITPAGIAALNSSLGSLIVMGGRLPEIHPGDPGIPPSELVFAFSDVGAHPLLVFPRLEILVVPEPSSACLLMIAIGLVSIKRQRRMR